VTFSPAATGTLSIADDATSPPSPETVALTGRGIPSSASSVVFANQTHGTASAAQAVTLQNTGAAILGIQAVALAAANPGDFAIATGSTSTNGATLRANHSCLIQLTFIPAGLGVATVVLTDDAADSPQMISLSGTTIPAPLVSLTPSNISFASQYVGTSGLPQSLTVTNTGLAPPNIRSVVASPGDFAALNTCGSSLAAGASCAIGVFFDPTTSGERNGTLTITDDAAGSPHTVTLSGTGQDFSVALSSSSTATVNPGQTAKYTLSVTPSGGFNQTVALS